MAAPVQVELTNCWSGGCSSGSHGAAIQLQGFAYLAGGLVCGIALFRAVAVARAVALLAVGGVVSSVLAVVPDAFSRALPNGVAMIALGYSLWRGQPT